MLDEFQTRVVMAVVVRVTHYGENEVGIETSNNLSGTIFLSKTKEW